MPARLHFSNSLDALADRLMEGIARARDPLSAPVIATPGAAMRDWLKVRIAEKAGIAANIEFPPLENLLWDQLAERDRHRENPDRMPARLLEPLSMQGLVMSRLRHDPPAALRAYLDSPHPEDAARRLVQLAGRLASLFREYEYNRVAERELPGLAESWMRGVPLFGPQLVRGTSGSPQRLDEVRELETWQMDVYRSLFREGDGLRDLWGAATKAYRYTLPQYAGMALADPVAPSDASRTYHLFGLSNISPFHRDLIGQLADADRLGAGAARFEVYALNPCAEYWEDALTLRERRARGLRPLTPGVIPPDRVAATRPDDEELEAGALRDAEDENGLLALFGKPGRETIKLWSQLTEHDFLEDFREPADPGLLGAVQSSVLRRAGASNTLPPDADATGSLRLRSAPDARSEIEAVRAEIAERLAREPGLRPEDCAVIPVDPESVLPVFQAVFAGGRDVPGNVPVLLQEAGAPDEHPLLRGFRTLLALGSTNADRRDLLGLLDNPAILAKAGLEADRLPAIAACLDAAGYREGWDDDGDDGSASTLEAAGRRLTWAFAIDGEDPAWDKADDDAPWAARDALPLLEHEDTAALLDWLEGVRDATRPLRDGRARSWPEWSRLLRGLREEFFAPREEDARADLDLRRFFDELDQWGRWLTRPEDADAVEATEVRILFEDRFRDVEAGGRTALLRGGVRVGSLASLRGLPFRHVWVTGLAGNFPSPGETAPLDLRGYRRAPGESDPAARDLYALLEVATATTGSLSLSWPRRDARGNDQQPSRALTGLAAWIESDLLVPGHRFPPPRDSRLDPPPSVPARVIAPGSASWAGEPAGSPVTDWRHLQEYMENPAWHAARRRFRVDAWSALDADDEDRAAALFLDRRTERALLDPLLRADLSGDEAACDLLERAWRTRRRGGLLPRAPYDGLEEERLRAVWTDLRAGGPDSLRGAAEGAGMRLAGTLRLGPQGVERAEPPVLNLPAFDASPLGPAMRLGGLLPWFFVGGRGDSGSWGLLVEEGREFPAYLLRLCADALIDAAPEALRDVFAGPAVLFVRRRKDGRVATHPLPSFRPDEARQRLADLLGDFARDGRDGRADDLPLHHIDAILKERGDDPAAIRDWRTAVDDSRRRAEESDFARGPFSERVLGALSLEIPEDAGDPIRRRVAPYLSWRRTLARRPGREDAA